jgi:hypothetical protein
MKHAYTATNRFGVQLSDQKIKDMVNYEFQHHKQAIEKMIKRAQEK